MTTANLLEQYLKVISTNTLHNDYVDRWQFYLESYMGGDEYRSGSHLVKYQLESESEYAARIANTPVDNHCKSVINVYTSFLFREEPDREFGTLQIVDPLLESFLNDADLEGRSFNAFMKEVSIWANVFGHAWCILSKPNVGAQTRADEINLGLRPYVSLVTPLTVIDWTWARGVTGAYELVYFKYVEEVTDHSRVIREWTKETIKTWTVNDKQRNVEGMIEEVNQLGRIPAVQVYAQRSPVRGIGISSISDISDQQKAIYNELSEVEQQVRLQNHPALVKTVDVEAGAGAGAIIQMPENLDPGLKPYLLEPTGNGLSHIYSSIQNRIESIDRMANIGAVRATTARTMSGVAMRTEFELLNARLSEMADNLELAEEQMWKIYCEYLGIVWDGEIDYPDSFNIQDRSQEIAELTSAKSAATDDVVLKVIDGEILELLGYEKELLAYTDPVPRPGRTYPDGSPIPESLPDAYKDSQDPGVPEGQNCSNCEYFKATDSYCIKFDAEVKPMWWCAKWDNKHLD